MAFNVTKKVAGDVYTITFTKVIKDVKGSDVTVVDRVDDVTLKQLQDRKQMLVDQIINLNQQIADLDAQILAVKAIV